MYFIFLGFALLASAISANKVLLASVPPTFFVGIRMLTAGLILWFMYYRTSPRLRWKYLKDDIFKIMLAALFTTCVPSLCKAFALKYMPSGKAAFIGSLDPFVTAIYSYFLFSDRLNFKKILGILVGFSGSMILCYSNYTSEQGFHAFLIFSFPELAAFAAMAIGRYGWLLAQSMLKRERYAPAELNGVMMSISGVLALCLSTFVDNYATISFSFSWQWILLFAYTVFVGNIIAYTMYATFLRIHSANFVSLAGFSVPIFVAFFGYTFLHERLTTNLVTSAMVILFGVYLFYQEELASLMRERMLHRQR
ncbi:MAG: DMT family transporter [Epsilonproteobacteria bacterium]|nr:DMT family transporter [Campylobacterota bacterium]